MASWPWRYSAHLSLHCCNFPFAQFPPYIPHPSLFTLDLNSTRLSSHHPSIRFPLLASLSLIPSNRVLPSPIFSLFHIFLLSWFIRFSLSSSFHLHCLPSACISPFSCLSHSPTSSLSFLSSLSLIPHHLLPKSLISTLLFMRRFPSFSPLMIPL